MNHERRQVGSEQSGNSVRDVVARINAYDPTERTRAVVNLIDGLARTQKPAVRNVALGILPGIDLTGVDAWKIRGSYLTALHGISEGSSFETSCSLLEAGNLLLGVFPKNEATVKGLDRAFDHIRSKVSDENVKEIERRKQQLRYRVRESVVSEFIDKESMDGGSAFVRQRADIFRQRLTHAGSLVSFTRAHPTSLPDIVYLIERGYLEFSLSESENLKFLIALGASELHAVAFGLLPSNHFLAAPDMEKLVAEKSNSAGTVETKKLRRWHTTLFSPIALTTMHDLPERRTVSYKKTARGEYVGDALVGHMLAFSEKYPEVALHDFFGSLTISKTAHDSKDDDKVVSYSNRFAIVLELLKARGHSLRSTDVSESLEKKGIHMNTVNLQLQLDQLERSGIITFTDKSSRTEFSSYNVNPTHPTEAPPSKYNYQTMLQRVWQLFVDNPDQAFTAPLLSERMVSLYPEYASQNRKSFTGNISGRISELIKKGYLTRGEFTATKQSGISLTPDQRAMLTDFVNIVVSFSTLKDEFLAEGRQKAAEILSDPQRVAALVEKSEKASPDMQKTSAQQTRANICTLLVDNQQYNLVTIRDLLAGQFGKQLTLAGVRYVMQGLIDSGQVASRIEKQTNYYSLVSSSEGDKDES